MLLLIRKSLNFLSPREKAVFSIFLGVRSLAGLLDLLAVLALGLLTTSIALFISQGSDPGRTVSIAGFVLPSVNIKLLPFVVGLIFSLFLLKAVVSIYSTKKMAIFIARIEARGASVILSNLVGSSIETLRRNSREQIILISDRGVAAAFTGLLGSTATLIAEGFLFLLLLAVFTIVDPISTLAVLAFFGVLVVAMQFTIGRLLGRASSEMIETYVEANSIATNLVTAFREIKTAGVVEAFLEKFEEVRFSGAQAAGRQVYLNGMPRYIVETAVLLGALILAGYKFMTSDLASAMTVLAVFLAGSMRMMAALLPWQSAIMAIKRDAPLAELAHTYISPVTGSTNAGRKVQEGKPLAVKFNKVSYTYPGSSKNAVGSLSFELKAGSQVALIGPSGSGKSTIADLMLGLIPPTRGKVLVGDYEGKEILSMFPGSVAYVPQRPGIIAGTIFENVAIGKTPSDYAISRVWEILEKVQLKKFVGNLEGGIDFKLTSTADGLSGGQLQRLGIARALYTSPGLLVLDEATSALDLRSEHEITKVIDSLRTQITVVVIAHRLNTVQRADKVFIVESGVISDSGTFRELLKRNKTLRENADLMSLN